MRRQQKHRRGFLLLEALMAMSLLAFGAAAFSEAFWVTHQSLNRSAVAHQLAACLDQTTWLALMGVDSAGLCANHITVQTTATPFSKTLVQQHWTASYSEGETNYESSVEGFRSAV